MSERSYDERTNAPPQTPPSGVRNRREHVSQVQWWASRGRRTREPSGGRSWSACGKDTSRRRRETHERDKPERRRCLRRGNGSLW